MQVVTGTADHAHWPRVVNWVSGWEETGEIIPDDVANAIAAAAAGNTPLLAPLEALANGEPCNALDLNAAINLAVDRQRELDNARPYLRALQAWLIFELVEAAR